MPRVSQRITSDRAKLGIQDSFYSFRHGRVSILRQSDAPGDLVEEWVGHSALRTTSHNTHFDHSLRQNIANKVRELTQLTQTGDKQKESKAASLVVTEET
jgi:integrase